MTSPAPSQCKVSLLRQFLSDHVREPKPTHQADLFAIKPDLPTNPPAWLKIIDKQIRTFSRNPAMALLLWLAFLWYIDHITLASTAYLDECGYSFTDNQSYCLFPNNPMRLTSVFFASMICLPAIITIALGRSPSARLRRFSISVFACFICALLAANL